MTKIGRKIYINGRFLSQKITGVNRYAYELCCALRQLGIPFVIVLSRSMTIHSSYDCKGWDVTYYGRGQSHIWEQLILPFFLLTKRHYYILSFTGLGPLLARNRIMTIHDLSFWEHPQWFSKGYYIYYRIMTPIAARLSKHILTVSQFSKDEICRLLHTKKGKVSVIYNAISKSFTQRSKTKREPYVLTVSSIDPRKNLQRLFNCFGSETLKDTELHVIGGKSEVFAQSKISVPPNVKLLGWVSEEELNRQYAHATLFVYPSLYEGFGLPPLEAMGHGCQVIASDIPVFRELFGEALSYFDPYSESDITSRISQALRSPQEDRIEKGFQLIGKYSWTASAKELIELLNHLNENVLRYE